MRAQTADKSTFHVEVRVPRDALVEFRRCLFQSGMSLQEFMETLIMLPTNNVALFRELQAIAAKQRKLNAQPSERVHTNREAFYRLLESYSPINNESLVYHEEDTEQGCELGSEEGLLDG